MTRKEAIEIVLDLAYSNMLTDHDCDTEELHDEQARQLEATSIVQDLRGEN